MFLIENIKKAILAGIMITIGCIVYLSCENKYIGAFLFSIALFLICEFNFLLFTGKVGRLGERFERKLFSRVILALIVNVVTCFVLGILLSFSYINLKEISAVIVANKLSVHPIAALVRSIFCGIIMYSAVYLYQEHRNSLGIFIGIPVFILSGFEHSIANTFYLSISYSIFTLNGLLFLFVNILGNAIGSICLAMLMKEKVEKF